MNRLTVLLLVVAGMIALSEAHWYALYTEKGQGGWRVPLNTDRGCEGVSFRVGSVNTGGGCIQLCSWPYCRGRCVRVALDGGDCSDHGDLGTCDFIDKAKSVKGC